MTDYYWLVLLGRKSNIGDKFKFELITIKLKTRQLIHINDYVMIR